MRIAVIVNPVSGLGTASTIAAGARLEHVRRLSRDAGVEVDVATTERAGHAAELAAQFVARGCPRIIAWGGDGTINEVAGPLIGSRTVLGIVPAGSGDGLARGLGLIRDPDAAFRAALTTAPKPVDAGIMGDHHFLNIGGIGFDAAVADAFNRRTKRGRHGYVPEALRCLLSYDCQSYEVSAEGIQSNGPHFVVAFANGPQYGSGIVIAPEADPADGLLDMIVVSGGKPWRQVWRARRLAFRRMAAAEGVIRARVTSATIRGERMLGHVDGQTFECRGTVSVSVRPGAILLAGSTSLL